MLFALSLYLRLFLCYIDDRLALFPGVSYCGKSAAEVPTYIGNYGICAIYHPAVSKLYSCLVVCIIQFLRNNYLVVIKTIILFVHVQSI